VENWEVDELFREADRNGDGGIDVEGGKITQQPHKHYLSCFDRPI